jgi:UDP-N-acetylmuramoyl-tripeptide--D-alanyl-D-alanine ligase
VKAWELDELRRGVKGKWAMRGESARAFNGRICTDSRKAAPGDFFVAIKGERFDAHAFVAAVIEKDVAAVLVHRELPAEILKQARERNVAIILVEDTVAGLNRLAAAYRSSELSGGGGGGFRAKVIAVGGSNGKTTTKRIIHTLLAEKFGAQGGHASPKSFNNNIGMPLTLLEVMPVHDYVVLEIGTNAPGEIAALGAVCRPDVAVIVSIGLEHLEKLNDLTGVAREEASIGAYVKQGGMMIVPEVPELLRELSMTSVQKLVVGMEGAGSSAELRLTGLHETAAGCSFSINGRGSFFVPLIGAHNAMNALMAVAVARRLGLSDEQIAAGLLKVTPAEGRFEKIRIGTWDVVHDAYNANPSSMEASLRTFARLAGNQAPAMPPRKVVVLADMLELGGTSAAMHRQVGQLVGELRFDLFVAIGSQMALAAEEARIETAGEVVEFADTASARAGISACLRPGDQILLKGSHGMALETILDTLRAAAGSAA